MEDGDSALVCTKTKISPQMVEDAIERYDSEGGGGDRNDFLAWFRKEGEKSPDRMPHRDLMNHLMNNLQVIFPFPHLTQEH